MDAFQIINPDARVFIQTSDTPQNKSNKLCIKMVRNFCLIKLLKTKKD